MKNFLVCIVLPFFVISCSTDSHFSTAEKDKSSATELNMTSEIPENRANPFDAKGKQYFKVLDFYMENNGAPNSFYDIAKQIQFLSKENDFFSSTNRVSIAISPELVSDIVNDPIKCLTSIAGACALSEEANRVLINYLTFLIGLKENEYEVLFDQIISYETAIIDSSTLNREEKEILLSLTSISRYSLYAESNDKDRDWEISVGNRKKQVISGRYDVAIVSMIALLMKLD